MEQVFVVPEEEAAAESEMKTAASAGFPRLDLLLELEREINKMDNTIDEQQYANFQRGLVQCDKKLPTKRSLGNRQRSSRKSYY